MVQGLGLGLGLGQPRRRFFAAAAAVFDPEAGLTLTETVTQGALDPQLDPHIAKPMVFAADVVFPTGPAQGVLFEHGGGGIGLIVTLRAGGGVLRVRAGDGASNPNMAMTAILDVTDFPTDGLEHTLVWDVRPQAPGRVRLWIDGDYKGAAETSSGGVLEGTKWSGGGTGGFATGHNANVNGEVQKTAWPATVNGGLRLYVNQQVVTD